MMKKKLLFVCVSLGLGGSERCMTEMLRNLDQSRYEITLLALIPVENKNEIPEGIRVINGYPGFEDMEVSVRKVVGRALRDGNIAAAVKRSLYWCRVNLLKKEYTACFWKSYAGEIPVVEESYDATIGYGPGFASFFAIDQVPNGGKKILWVNTNLVRAHFDLEQHRRLYAEADHIVAVCRNLLRDLQGYYPECREKMSVFYDMLDVEGIQKASRAFQPAYPAEEKNRILTVGRICEAKALHLAAEAAAILKERGFDFRWYILGDGSGRSVLESRVRELDVGDRVVLLGALNNPYPWFAGCDIYVQTSVYEGSCTTITEALILGKPVVTTDIDIAPEKINDGYNGLICAMTGQDIADKLQRLLTQPGLKQEMEQYIQRTPVFYGDQIGQFYDLLESL